MSKEVSLQEMFESIQRDIDRGYPDYENFEPMHCKVGTIYPIRVEAAEHSVQRTGLRAWLSKVFGWFARR